MNEDSDSFPIIMKRLARLRHRRRKAAAKAKQVAEGREARQLPTRSLKIAARKETRKRIARRKSRRTRRPPRK